MIFGSPVIGEEEIAEVDDSPRSGWLGTGPKEQRLEAMLAENLGGPLCLSMSSCTAALFLTMRALGIGFGDELPAMTFVARAGAVEHAGATPVLVDSEKTTGLTDLDAVEAVGLAELNGTEEVNRALGRARSFARSPSANRPARPSGEHRRDHPVPRSHGGQFVGLAAVIQALDLRDATPAGLCSCSVICSGRSARPPEIRCPTFVSNINADIAHDRCGHGRSSHPFRL